MGYIPNYKHINIDIERTKDYILKRRDGLIPSANTGFQRLNNYFLDGIPWNSIFTIVGMSGQGKSTFMEQIKYSILNSADDIEVLSFELDMLIRNQIIRQVSKKTGISSKAIKSSNGFVLTEDEKALVDNTLLEMSELPIYNIDNPMTVENIEKNILHFVAEKGYENTGKKLLITIDYVTLVKSAKSDDKKKVLDELYEMLVGLKSFFENKKMNVLVICLSQTNRDIMTANRVQTPSLHAPTEADIMASSSVFQNSDFLVFIMAPYKIRGLEFYTQYKRPLKALNGLPYIYLHVLKNREGDTGTIEYLANFKEFKMMEVNYQ